MVTNHFFSFTLASNIFFFFVILTRPDSLPLLFTRSLLLLFHYPWFVHAVPVLKAAGLASANALFVNASKQTVLVIGNSSAAAVQAAITGLSAQSVAATAGAATTMLAAAQAVSGYV